MHSEQPTLATRGMVAQPQIHVQLLSAMIDFELNVQQAISAPRWHTHCGGLAPGW
jgi:gamma-glutamyltranspeptidase